MRCLTFVQKQQFAGVALKTLSHQHVNLHSIGPWASFRDSVSVRSLNTLKMRFRFEWHRMWHQGKKGLMRATNLRPRDSSRTLVWCPKGRRTHACVPLHSLPTLAQSRVVCYSQEQAYISTKRSSPVVPWAPFDLEGESQNTQDSVPGTGLLKSTCSRWNRQRTRCPVTPCSMCSWLQGMAPTVPERTQPCACAAEFPAAKRQAHTHSRPTTPPPPHSPLDASTNSHNGIWSRKILAKEGAARAPRTLRHSSIPGFVPCWTT